MKYQAEYIDSLVYKDYIELIERTLKQMGYKNENGQNYEFTRNYRGGFVAEFAAPFLLLVKDPCAIRMLKEQGLINNGRCPLTGMKIGDDDKRLYTSDENPNVSFEISREWVKANRKRYNWGCLIAIAVLITFIVLIVSNGFDLVTRIFGGLSVLTAIVSVFLSMGRMGINMNVANAASEIGITTVAFVCIEKYVCEMRKMLKSHSSRKVRKLTLAAKGDLHAYMKWNSVEY